MHKITIIIADDHPLIRLGMVNFLKSNPAFQVVGDAENGDDAMQLIKEREPDIAILDVDMPGRNGLEICQWLKEEKKLTRTIILTLHKELDLYKKAMEYGASGYLLKEHALSELEEAVEQVYSGNTFIGSELASMLTEAKEISPAYKEQSAHISKLTKTERDILLLISQQFTSADIAQKLFISEKTVKNHRHNIVKKLDLPPEQNSLLKFALEYAQLIK